jgi:hypothetical protein
VCVWVGGGGMGCVQQGLGLPLHLGVTGMQTDRGTHGFGGPNNCRPHVCLQSLGPSKDRVWVCSAA